MKKRSALPPPDELLFTPKQPKRVPFAFVLDALAPLSPYTRPMFGCLGVYVEDQIVLVLRADREPAEDNGVWIATTREHHKSLRAELPGMRSIGVLGPDVTSWQNLPADAVDFEEAALRVTRLILAGDPRIGKVPQSRRPRRPDAAPPATKKAKPPARKGR